MKMKDIAKPAINAVDSGEIRFHPEHWVKTYNHWMKNIKDWCISRQLIWGHQIPVWYHKEDNSKLHVSVEGPDDIENWVQEKDVLDTWASSWLWPLGVHSWPDKSKDLDKFFPTNTLVTGPDIIFFWVARMIMTGYEFLGKKPFSDVYFTSILRDDTGKKLSKSLGNSPDPLDLFDEYGTDAVRFGIMLMAPQGLDVLFSKDRLEIGRNFMNKLWNACRFIEMNTPGSWSDDFVVEQDDLELADKWILNQLDRLHFNEAAKVLYDFVWNDFCDWYIEIAKTRFYSENAESKMITYSTCLKCIRIILPLMHPFTPFITEELWSFFKDKNQPDLIVSMWPNGNYDFDDDVDGAMTVLQELITSIRAIRSRMNIAPSKNINLKIKCSKDQSDLISQNKKLFMALAKIDSYDYGSSMERPPQSATAVVHGMELYIPLDGLVDLDKEKMQLEKRKIKIEGLLVGIYKKLSNKQFINNAPENVVDGERKKGVNLRDELTKINSNLEILS